MLSSTRFQELIKLIRYNILVSTSEAGSGHPSSALSAVELGTVLFFGGILKNSDHFILSKGHASPLLYSLYQVGGLITRDELMTFRKFGSRLQGHPTLDFPYVDVATGSLGQGLSVAVGMLMGLRLLKDDSKVFVLCGDSEFAEGQNWEALEIASYYKLGNLIGILDVNRLGQSRETMLGWDIKEYGKRAASFGWRTVLVEDGNDLIQVQKAYKDALVASDKPTMIIAKTVKGKGFSFLENKEGWHGKPVPKDQLDEALRELGEVDLKLKGSMHRSEGKMATSLNGQIASDTKDHLASQPSSNYPVGQMISTREAYGETLALVGQTRPNIVSFDGEVSNSTLSEKFRDKFPGRYFEMFIAEQNMVSAALGASKVGLTPFVSTFGAFFSRAYDQIRMSQYSNANIKLVGSHSGVSIGQDGPSQMALEDISMMRSILHSVVLYPADAIATSKLVQLMADYEGLIYLRTNRPKTPVIYSEHDEFEIGGSKIINESEKDTAVIFTAGITVHEAIKARKELEQRGVSVAVVDLYSIKPIDQNTIRRLSLKAGHAIVVEDHYPYGGLGEAVKMTLPAGEIKFTHLAVTKIPKSGTTEKLLSYEGIDSDAIVQAVLA